MRYTIPDTMDDVQLRQLTITTEAEIIKRYNVHAKLVRELETTVRMLEAAHRSLGMWSEDNPRVKKARAALAEARGITAVTGSKEQERGQAC